MGGPFRLERMGVTGYAIPREKYSWFCRCDKPDIDEVHSCRVCYRLVYRDDY